MELAFEDLGEYVHSALGAHLLEMSVERGELAIVVEREAVVHVLKFLRDDVNCQFAQLMDVCGADYPGREPRFDVVYNLLSLVHNRRIRVKVSTSADVPVPTATGVFSSAGWWERETWDMYGILFRDHPDLRRILSDYGFEGYPLRKDFPLTGYTEVRWDDEQKRIVYEPVTLAQDFRTFDFLSPWEGMQDLLPGDEKAVRGAESERGRET
jgi:NADH-quinone oxidoreductase subunit C